jgi:hypothetical protein
MHISNKGHHLWKPLYGNGWQCECCAMEFGRACARGGSHLQADGAAVHWCQDVDFAFLTVLCLCICGTTDHAGIRGGMS